MEQLTHIFSTAGYWYCQYLFVYPFTELRAAVPMDDPDMQGMQYLLLPLLYMVWFPFALTAGVTWRMWESIPVFHNAGMFMYIGVIAVASIGLEMGTRHLFRAGRKVDAALGISVYRNLEWIVLAVSAYGVYSGVTRFSKAWKNQ